MSPSHTYSSAGTYTISLVVTDNQGATGSITGSIVVSAPNVAPSAFIISSSGGGQAPINISFDGTGSTDNDGSIVSYQWNYGDGSTGNGSNVNHTYTSGGTFTVTLVVTDNDGATDQTTTSVVIAAPNVSPIASFTNSAAGQAPINVLFDASGSSDPDGTISSYSWDFGDGNSGTGANANHTYVSGGTFTVTLTVTDNQGATGTTSSNVVIAAPNVAPTAAFTSSTTTGTAPLAVSFNASTSSDDAGITSYAWDYGDGSNGSGVNASHSYANAGTYTVTLTVSDAQGLTDQATTVITVNAAPTGIAFESGTVSSVGTGWVTVNLANTYTSMVVVATPIYSNANNDPVVTRVRNASGSSFQLKIQEPGGNTSTNYDVEYVVVEEGVYTQANDGVKMEAVRVSSGNLSYKNGWKYNVRNYSNAYSTPVVVGQVMTDNDADWSVFYATRYNSRTNVPSNSINGFSGGIHVGEDNDKTRSTETIGIIVIEGGTGSINSLNYAAGYTNDFVRGTDNSGSGYSYSIPIVADHAVLSSSGMDGGDGGWPVFSSSPSGSLKMWVDEDQISNSERRHTTEQVAYLAIGSSTNKYYQPVIANNSDSLNVHVIEVDLYPNPTSHAFYLEFSQYVGEQVQVSIVDINGREVMDLTAVELEGNTSTAIAVDELANGQYFVIIKGENILQKIPFIRTN